MPVRAGLVFALFSAVWLILTDVALGSATGSDQELVAFQLLKGMVYTVLIAILMYWLLKWSLRRTMADQIDAERNAERLAIALAATRSGVWEWHFPTRKFYLSSHLTGKLHQMNQSPRTWGDLVALIHPEDQPLFGSVIRNAVDMPDQEHSIQYRLKSGSDSYIWLEARGRLLTDSNGQPTRVAGVLIDISHTKEKDSHIERLTHFDPLTGLPNRAKFMRTLESRMEQRKASESFVLVARLDISRFQDVNSVLGAAGGDKVLSIFGHRLEDVCGRHGVVSRFAGDDFAIAVSSLESAEAAQELAGAISQMANLPIELDGESVTLTTVMGTAIAPNDGELAETLVSYAELALARARSEGQILGFYQVGMNEAFRERAYLERELAAALRSDGLSLAFQPIVKANDQSLVGFEALARWNHPKLGMVSPAVFIPAAESCGLIAEVGRFVLRTACLQVARWNSASARPVMVAINVSARQMDDDRFVAEVASVLAETGLPPECLELEVTESVIMSDFEAIRGRLQRLRDLGVHVAVDDFGTGYSSLAVLKQLPVSKLKIDRSFVKDLNNSEGDNAIVAAILELAQSMNLAVTAEGVETAGQLDFLRMRQCDTVQGYLISPPLPADALQPFLTRSTDGAGRRG